MGRRHRILVALAAVVLAAVGLGGASGDAGSARWSDGAGVSSGADHLGGAGHAGARSTPAVSTVTLITGDRVRLTSGRDGTRTVIPIPGAGRAEQQFGIRYAGARIDVVPADAAPLVLAGKLDSRLFDVAGLVAAGLDDARSREIPLLVTYERSRSGAPAVTRGTSAVRMDRVRMGSGQTTKMAARKDDAAAFWQWIAGPRPARPGEVETAATVAATGVQSVALDLANRPTTIAGVGADTRGRAAPAMASDHLLTMRLIDRNGRLVTDVDEAFLTQPVVLNRDTEDVIDLRPSSHGLVARVPNGHYSFGEIVVTSHGFKPNSYSLLARPDFDVSGNLTLTLDARKARRVRLDVDAHDTRAVVTTFGSVEMFAGRPWSTLVTLPGSARYGLFATPTGAVTDRSYDFAMFQSLSSGRGTYDVVVGQAGRIPTNLTYKVHDRDLVKVDGKFYAGGTGLDLAGVWYREAQLPGDVQLGLGWFYNTAIPATRRHLSSPDLGGTSMQWSSSLDVQQVGGPLWYTEMRDPVIGQAGDVASRPWGPAGFRPEGDGVRTGTVMAMTFQPFSAADAPGTRIIIWDDSGIAGQATLHRGSVQAAHADKPFSMRSDPQPAQLSWYKLDLAANRSVPWSRYATRVQASWTFSCDTPAGMSHPMRMLNIRPTGAFDMYGRAPAGRSFRLDLPLDMVEHAGRVVEMTLQVSYDDGKTWTKVPTVKDTNTLWHAMLTHPDKPGGFVSLKTAVSTDSGHRAAMTTIRAYGLAGGA